MKRTTKVHTMPIVLKNLKSTAPGCSNYQSNTLFVFKDMDALMNYATVPRLLNRLQRWTYVYLLSNLHYEDMLTMWSESRDRGDCMFDSVNPVPNTKHYVWKDEELNKLIQKKRYKQQQQRSRGRIHLRPDVKSMIKDELIDHDHYVIEMIIPTFDAFLDKSNISHNWRFRFSSTIQSGGIGDYTLHRINKSFLGFVRSIGGEAIVEETEYSSIADDDDDDDSNSDLELSSDDEIVQACKRQRVGMYIFYFILFVSLLLMIIFI